MMEEYYPPPQQGPMMYYDIPKRGILDRPNGEFVNDESNLKIIREYSQVMPAPTNASQKKVYTSYWGFINNQANLTFYDPKYKLLYDINWELSRLSYLMSLRPGEFDEEMRIGFQQVRQYADIIFYRCVGTKPGITNERIAQQTSVLQQITSNMGGSPYAPQGGGGFGGFFSKLLGRR